MRVGGDKIFFRVEQDDDGYPPVSTESVWAQPTERSREYVVDNVPFFAREATLGDTVSVTEREGVFWYEATVRCSQNSLLRVVLFDPASRDGVLAALSSLGCTTEYLGASKLVAVNIPIEVPLVDVQDYLRREAMNGLLDYEEPILRQ